jgi:hypothetical protein
MERRPRDDDPPARSIDRSPPPASIPATRHRIDPMRQTRVSLTVLGLGTCLVGILAGPLDAQAPPEVPDRDAFPAVRAVLTDKCLACHASETRKGGLDLTRRASAIQGGESGEAIVPGRPDESPLFEKLSRGEMPPKEPLKPLQVAAFRTWIEQGAPYADEPLAPRRAGPDWWSLQPVRRPAIPTVADPGWVRNPIDAFVLHKLEEQGLAPSPEASRSEFIRRVSFDLIGLPPTPEEVRDFAEDPSVNTYESLVDRLLASPRYGERWARHWLDVVRFAESHGYETNALRPNAWPYRDYVIRAFNRDTPFPRFVAEQLAADALPDADWLTQAATGFLVGAAHDVVGNQTVEGMLQQRADDLDDMITATGTAFLGVTVNCARCHDHKFDPIGQKDYYGMQAVFAGVGHAEREVAAPDAGRRRERSRALIAELSAIDRQLDEREPIARPDLGAPGRPPVRSRRNVERFAPVEARFVRFTVQATNNGIEPCIDELEIWTAGDEPRNVALASEGAIPSASSTYPNSDIHRLEHLNDGRVGNGRSWISAVAGKGWCQVELPRAEVIDRIIWGRDREEKYKDRTPTEYYIEAAVVPGQWRVVASSADREPYRMDARGDAIAPTAGQDAGRDALLAQQQSLRERIAALSPTLKVYAGTFTQPGPTHLLRRGDPQQKQDAVPPSGLHAVRPPLEIPADAPERERRLALAGWIGDPANPLPPRVWVNRAWHHHFGQGLVETPSDFGFNGGRPSHPLLLDWLATELLANGGRLKPIHRLLVLSAAYRQSSKPPADRPEATRDPRAVDAANRLLWRMSPRRLEAEAIRDAIVAVSGTLDHRMGGPGYDLWEPNTNYVVVFKPKADLGPDELRRMIYQFKPRSQQDPTFGAFDCPDGGLVAPKRNSSTTALQALNLLNSRFILAQSEALADRLRREAGDDPEAQVRRAFWLAYTRDPSDEEASAAVALVRQHGAAALGRALYNSSEFLYAP